MFSSHTAPVLPEVTTHNGLERARWQEKRPYVILTLHGGSLLRFVSLPCDYTDLIQLSADFTAGHFYPTGSVTPHFLGLLLRPQHRLNSRTRFVI